MRSTGEVWHTAVYASFYAAKNNLRRGYGIILDMDNEEYGSGINPKDPSQTATASRHEVTV